jgi:hypothetical protein
MKIERLDVLMGSYTIFYAPPPICIYLITPVLREEFKKRWEGLVFISV